MFVGVMCTSCAWLDAENKATKMRRKLPISWMQDEMCKLDPNKLEPAMCGPEQSCVSLMLNVDGFKGE